MITTYNEDLELISLACLIKDGSCYGRVEDILNKNTYVNPVNKNIFVSIRELYNSDTPPDKVSLIVDLQRRSILDSIILSPNGLQGKEAIEYLDSMTVNPDNVESYVFQLCEIQGDRETYGVLKKAINLMEEGQRHIPVWGMLDLEGGKISSYSALKNNNTKSIKNVAEDGIKNLISAIENKHLFISTGMSAWDDYVNGLFPGRLYLVAARAGKGKSTLCINLAYRLAVVGNVKTTYLTFESSSVDIFNKLIQMMTGISTKKIDRGTLTEEEKEKVYKAAKKLKESDNLVLDDSSEILLPVLRSKMRKASENGSKVFIIDQLDQILVGGGGDSTQQEFVKINYITYRIKAIAKELGVAVILVHQMNKQSDSGLNRGKDTEPQLSDLYQAGDKAPNAVLMISQMSDGGTYFFWRKNRDYGEMGKRKVDFLQETITFQDIAGLSEFSNDHPEFRDEENDS